MSEAWDDRKKALENEHFRRKEQEALEKLRERMETESRAQVTAAAALRCPKCDGTLETVSFENVQIDRCNKCQGVWLDAGELEQLTKHEAGGWFGRFRNSMSSTE
ncbi:MAG: zf-TFIIB domain-containing protein [Pyrinomonadaceae bacterium]|jgi:protein-arginine kinase activator protein McsA|nr:zf-TFIIB domain-containing protein [Pyrinomonadaceae bacterium]